MEGHEGKRTVVEWEAGREAGDKRAEAEKIGEGGLGGEIICREKKVGGTGGTWGEATEEKGKI